MIQRPGTLASGQRLDRYAVELVNGHARFAVPRAVAVTPQGGAETRTLTADFFVKMLAVALSGVDVTPATSISWCGRERRSAR